MKTNKITKLEILLTSAFVILTISGCGITKKSNVSSINNDSIKEPSNETPATEVEDKNFLKKDPMLLLTGENVAKTKIIAHTLSLSDAVDIVYYVQNNTAYDSKGLLIWKSYQDEYTYENAQYRLTSNEIDPDDGSDVYVFKGLSPKEMTVDIYAVSYLQIDGAYYYSKVNKYSVLEYCYNKKDDTSTVNGGSKTLGQTVQSILGYGAAMQQYFNFNTSRLANSTYHKVTVVNGYLEDKTNHGLYQEGETITLDCDVTNFCHWIINESTIYTSKQIKLEDFDSDLTFYAQQHDLNEYDYCSSCGKSIYQDSIDHIKVWISSTDEVQIYEIKDGIETIEIPSYIKKDGDYFPVTEIDVYGTGTTKTIIVGNNTTKISHIHYSETLETVIVKDSVTSIGNRAFESNHNLTKVVLPSTITNLSDYMFEDCTSLSNVDFLDYIESLGEYCFRGCSSLKSISLPDSITSIPYACFYNCSSLASIEMTNVTSIASMAFRNTGFVKLTIPDSVETISSNAFEGCSKLKEIDLGKGCTSVGNFAFKDAEFEKLTIYPQVRLSRYCFKLMSEADVQFKGTKTQWTETRNSVVPFNGNYGESITIHCTDGDVVETIG